MAVRVVVEMHVDIHAEMEEATDVVLLSTR